MYGWLRRFIGSFESSSVPMPYFAACFLLWVSLRNVLETFVFRTPLPPLTIVHFDLAYASIALWLAVAIGLATGRNPVGALRPMLAGFLFVLLAPSIDWALGANERYRIAYLVVDSWKAIGLCYLTFFGPLAEVGITPGIRIEVAIVLCVCFLYVHVFTRSLVRALLAVVAAWTIIFVNVAMKSILPLVARGLGVGMTEGFELYIHTFAWLVALGIAAVVALGAPRAVAITVRDSRPLRALHYLLLFALGLAYAKPPAPLGLEHVLQIGLAAFAIWLAWVSAVMINNVFDVEIDRINAPERPLVTGELDRDAYLRWGLWIGAGSLALGWAAGFMVFFLLAIFGLAYFVYSAPPLRLKTRCFVSKAVIGVNSTACLLAGYMLWGEPMLTLPGSVVLSVLIGFSLGAHVIDLKDVEGDRAAGIKNLSTMLGLRRAQWVIGGLALVAYLGFAFVLREHWLGAVFAVAGPVQLLLVTRKKYSDAAVVAVQNVVIFCAALAAWGV